MKRLCLALLVIILASMLVGCGPTDSPEQAAREWLDALLNLDGNKLAERTCDAQEEDVQSGAIWRSAIAAFGEMLTGQREQADISDLQFVTISKSGDTAQVRVTGEIRTAVLAIAQKQQVDETWQMVRESGKWKWCGTNEQRDGAQPVTTQVAQTTLKAESIAAGVWENGGALLVLDFTSSEAAQAARARFIKKAKDLGLAASWMSHNSLFLLLPPMDISTLNEHVLREADPSATMSRFEAVGPAIVNDIDQGSLMSTGGLMSILQANLPGGYAPSDDAMNAAIQTIDHQLGDLVGKGYWVQRLGLDKVLVLLPGMLDPASVLGVLSSNGALPVPLDIVENRTISPIIMFDFPAK